MKKIILTIGMLSVAAMVSWSSLPIGSTRSEVYQAMGEPISDILGLKWTYKKGASSIVAHFNNDILVRGFIIE